MSFCRPTRLAPISFSTEAISDLPDITVWMDAECTVHPFGFVDTLYVKFNRDFGFNGETMWGGYANPNTMLFVFTPTTDYPNETYQVRAFRNFFSKERSMPFRKGNVVRIHNDLEAMESDEFQIAFNGEGVG